MRTLTDHIVEGDTAPQLTITVIDEPGAGGANYEYEITSEKQQDPNMPGGYTTYAECCISFQNGPIKEAGVNGVTHEALLAVLIDRLRSFQAGPFACEDNEGALMHAEGALSFLQRRSKDRIKRGVEGKATA